MNNPITTILFKHLSTYQSITLDGIGSLVCNSIGAEIDSEKGTITPPHHTITFDSSLNNTSLISLIEQQLKQSSIEASKSYKKWIKERKTTIDKVDMYKFEGVGTLVARKNGVVFTSDTQLISILAPMTSNQLINSNIDMKKEVKESKTQPSKPNVVQENNKSEQQTSNKGLITVLVLLLIAALSLAAYFYQSKPKEIIKQVVVEKIVEVPAKVDTVAVAPKVVESAINDGKYHIIAGMYINEKGAKKTVAKAKKEGFTEAFYAFLPHVNKYGVSLKSFDNKADAQATLNSLYYKIDIKEDNDMMWIYDKSLAVAKK